MNIKKAKVIRLSTQDGLFEFADHISIGMEYDIDTDKQEDMKFYNTEHDVYHDKLMVYDILGGYLPVECLKIED